MIDFYGATSSGKTLYLYAIIIATILPKSWKYSKSKPPIPLSGKARSVVFVDMDQGFSAQRLKTLLCLEIVSRINDWNEKQQTMKEQETDEKPNPDRDTSESDPAASHRDYMDPGTLEMQAKIEQLAMSCLRNVHVFRPPDAISTIAMLRTLDQYLMNLSSDPMMIAASITAGIKPGSTTSRGGAGRAGGGAYSKNPPFALLILDSLSSFFWQERAHANHARFMTLLVEALNRLAKWKLVYISTTWYLPSSFSTTDRTVTDRLRERLKYRFQMQPRTLERFDTEEKLLYEWSRRRRRQTYQRGTRESGALGEWQGNNKASSTTSVEDTGSLFQVQMVHPSVEHPRQEVFRFSISNTRGIHSFSVPSLS
ncbi:MAG: hypothetical protein J3Q66DRAFT_177018 [Benniella sp.]|nr:MAG: hypothetical protein J3Q66DRAFT_177018 [Benniella sp.]